MEILLELFNTTFAELEHDGPISIAQVNEQIILPHIVPEYINTAESENALTHHHLSQTVLAFLARKVARQARSGICGVSFRSGEP
ncbi:MAG: hypothetical protein ACXWCP_27805 [Burkholderiales bacterium]